jgi:nucleoporin POM152
MWDCGSMVCNDRILRAYELRLTSRLGQAPFDLDYKYTREGHSGKHTLKSAQDVGVLHLAMDPGRHRYEFTDLKDSNYAHTKVSFSLEHEVHSRPSISFVRPNSKPICLDSPLHSEARVRTQGKAPFSVTFSVRKPASASTSLYTLSLDSPEWTLDLPQHLLSEIGRHEVTIAAMSDASGCKWEVNELDRLSTVVEVVESARIVPVNQDEDLCVGDRLDFLLQGKAPWSIEYVCIPSS